MIDLHPGDLLHAYTYTMNYFQDRSWWVGHLWSLSVEEQFYLLWPATMLFLGTRKGLRMAMVVVLLSPFMRLGTDYFWIAQRANIGLCVCRVTIRTEDWTGRALNWPPLVFLGTLSYSLYLWQ